MNFTGYGFHFQDALLHAIKEEYVEAVEILLQHEEKTHVAGQPYVSQRTLHSRQFLFIYRLFLN